jgi:membrane protease YdiL (CAAX protease family)
MDDFGQLLPPQPEPRPWALAPEPEPPFGLVEVFFFFLALLLALLLCGAAAFVVARHLDALRHVHPSALGDDPRVVLGAQLAAYLLLLAVLARYFHHLRVGFCRALQWHFPARWPSFLIGGILLSVAIQWISQWLPSPSQLPIDQMFRSRIDAWLMSLFGVFIAPFAEEILFRGLLFPALARRTGAVISVILTASLFAAVHAQQLGEAWLQVACIFVVGIVLTVVRWRFHSVASSALVHMGYNGLLFSALFMQTNGFTHLPPH